MKYEDLRVGMRVRVLDDREFVEAECERVVEGAEEHVEWTEDMAACVGVEGEIKRLKPDFQAARVEAKDEAWLFPFTVLREV